jgi:hypothetical protein
VGIARDASTGDPFSGQRVQARWVASLINVSPSGYVVATDEARYAEDVTRESGLFVLCGLPGSEELVLKSAGSELGDQVTLDGRIAWRDLFIDR